MTVRELNYKQHKYIGDTGDTKPTAATHGATPGSTYYDRETGILYITYDGTNWVEKDTIVRLETSPSIDIGDVTLLAGTALVGKVGIDQTTPGTTNAVVEASAAAIKTSVELIDNAIAGTELQVDVVAALPAGTNAIGKLAANSGVDIGDVDVLSLPALPAGANNIGDVDVLTEPATAADAAVGLPAVVKVVGGYDGTNVQAISTDVNGRANVTVVDALPTEANAIGKLAANTGVDIGDVDILSIAVGDNNIGNVDIASAIPAGTNAIGKLAANSGVDIGDVDVLTEPSGSGAYTTPTHSAPSIAATTTEALASNANRLYALLINDSDASIYIKLGAAAVMNQGIRLNASGGSYEMSKKLGNLYTGAINGISAAGSKILLVLEGV